MEKWKFCGLIVLMISVLMFAPVTACDVKITKTGPSDVCTNGEITYSIKVSYEGNAGYYVNVSDTLPAGVTFVSASDNGFFSGGNVLWNFGPMPSGTNTNNWWTRTVTVTVKPTGTAAIVKNKAKVRYWYTERDCYGRLVVKTSSWKETSVATSTNVVPCYTEITKSAPSEACTNCELTYDLHVKYTGLNNQNVEVKDVLPAGVNFVSASDGGVNTAGTVVWAFGPVTSGWSKDLTLVVNPGAEGTLTNVATSSVSGLGSAAVASSNVVTTDIIPCTPSPEFPTMVFPAVALIGTGLIAGYLRRRQY